MPTEAKTEKVKDIKERLTAAQAAIFADFRGLTVQDAKELRTSLAEVQARFSVVKNSLARLAVREAGLEGLEAFLEGPTALALIAGDPVAGAKRLLDASRKFPVLEVKGGLAEGRILSADEVKALAALESREAMLAKIAGLGKMEMSRAAWMFQALQSQFLSLLEAYKDKLPAPEPSAPEQPEEPSAPAPSARGAGSADASGPEPDGAAQDEEEAAPLEEPAAAAEPAEEAETETTGGSPEEAVAQDAGGVRAADEGESSGDTGTEEEGGS